MSEAAAAPTFSARLLLECDDEPEASALAGALSVEAADALPKARARVERDGATVRIDVEARDAPSLRAAVNSYLRWARVAEDAARLGGRARGDGGR